MGKKKTFRAAAELKLAATMPGGQLTEEQRQRRLTLILASNRDAYTLIWDNAQEAEYKAASEVQQELRERLDVTRTSLHDTTQTAANRLARIKELERELSTATGLLLARNKELADALEKVKELEAVSGGRLGELVAKRDQVSKAQARSLELLRSNQTLRSQNEDLKHRMVEATIPVTSRTLDQALTDLAHVERQLEAEQEQRKYTERLLASSREASREMVERNWALLKLNPDEVKVSKRPQGEGWILGWSRFTPAAAPKPCGGTRGRWHVCVYTGAHTSEPHACSCGHHWYDPIVR